MKDITRVPRISQKAYWNESLIPLGSSTFFSLPSLFSLGSNPVCLFSLFISMPRTRLPSWQNHQTHRRKILQGGGAQPVNTSYWRRILTSSALSTDPATEMSSVNWTPHGLQSNGMSWSNDRLRELARSRRERTSSPPPASSAWFHISSTTRCHGTARLLHTGARGSYSGHGGVISTNGLAGECHGWSSGGEWRSPGAIASTIRPQRSIGVILRTPWKSSASSGSSAGHPLNFHWRFSGAPESTVRGAVDIQWGAVETAAAAVTATAAVVGAVGGSREIHQGSRNAIQALSAMTPVNGAVDGAMSTVIGAVNTINGAMNGAMITVNGAVKWAMNTVKGAVNRAVSAVNRATNTERSRGQREHSHEYHEWSRERSRDRREQGRRYLEPVDSPHREHRGYSNRGYPPEYRSRSPSHGDHHDFEDYPPSSHRARSYQSPELSHRNYPASYQSSSTLRDRDLYGTPPRRSSVPEDHGPSTSDAWESILGPRPRGYPTQPPELLTLEAFGNQPVTPTLKPDYNQPAYHTGVDAAKRHLFGDARRKPVSPETWKKVVDLGHPYHLQEEDKTAGQDRQGNQPLRYLSAKTSAPFFAAALHDPTEPQRSDHLGHTYQWWRRSKLISKNC